MMVTSAKCLQLVKALEEILISVPLIFYLRFACNVLSR